MSDTGRFYITSPKTGKTYLIEPGYTRTEWGSVYGDELRTKKGWKKYQGGVKKEDSIIKEENGLKNIKELPPGMSPLKYIEELEKGL